jgi:hypothetical protein
LAQRALAAFLAIADLSLSINAPTVASMRC